MIKSYGINKVTEKLSKIDAIIEEINIKGYSLVEGVINKDSLNVIRERLDKVYEGQVEEFGEKNLESIKELNLARCLLAYDDYFTKIAANEFVLQVVKKILGEYFILHLQNGIINQPSQEHHQSSWHRDLPYQDFIISSPLAVNAFWCIDDFNKSTGSTIILPFSHKLDHLPSEQFIENNCLSLTSSPGSILFFDSMMYHRAGLNTSNKIRRGINNMYVAPILKQQVSLPGSLKGKFDDDPFLSRLLGYQSIEPENVKTYRTNRLINK